MKLPPLIVALDVDHIKKVETLLKKLGSTVKCYKVGMKLYTHYGPDIIRYLRKKRKQVFLDLKYHDIPNTVAGAVEEATRLRVQMLTVHASGGSEMMKAAAKAAREEAKRLKLSKPLIMGVTVLTSMDSLEEIGIFKRPSAQVHHLATLASKAKLDGVICSPQEIKSLRDLLPRRFKIVTPGVRPLGSAKGDQKRVKTPEEAFALGADAIVVGRPIIQAKDPQAVAKQILRLA